MPYTFDERTKAIVLPAGDTLSMDISVDGDGFSAVLFAVYPEGGRRDLIRLPAELDENNIAHIRLSNERTRDLCPGVYKWSLRLISDPERDEDGNIIAEDASDNVLTVFGPAQENIPSFTVTDGRGRV